MASGMRASHSVEYRYAAFISYRHVEADRTWALWLHRALESYRIPKRLVAGGALPNRIGRIFRDEEELEASANLSEGIDSALRASRFLIVICSRSTPGSQWVNAEVERFRALGRGERILTLLTEGDPGSAFPRALYEIRDDVFESQQPLAADVRANNVDGPRTLRQRALLRLLATIIGCRFDDLRQREHERRTRRLIAVGAILAALSMILSAATVITYRARETAEAQRSQATQRLADLYGRNALALLEGEDNPGALLWLAAAVDAAPQAAHRWRMLFSETRRQTPSLIDAIIQPTMIEGFGASAATERFAVGGRDGLLRIGSRSEDVITVRVCEHGTVNDARFSRDGRRVVTAASDGTARVWDAATGQPISPPLQVGGIVHWASLVDGEDTIVTIGSFADKPDWMLRVWKADGEPMGKVWNLGSDVTSVAFEEGGSHGSVVATGDSKGRVRVYDTRRGLVTTAALRHDGEVQAVAFDGSGRYVASASEDDTARIWDAGNGRAVTPPLRHDDSVTSVAFDPTGTRVVTGSWDHSARVWSVATGHPLSAAMRSNDGVLAVAFDATGTRVATGAFAGMARVWDAATGDPLTPPLQLDDDADGVSLFDSELVTRSGRVVRVWRLDHVSPRAMLVGHQTGEVRDAELSPDGSRFATASVDSTARVWDARTGVPITPSLQHAAAVLNIAFSADGQRVLTTDDDGNVRAWDATTGSPLGPWLRHREWAEYAQFVERSGTTVIVAGGDNAVHVWDYESGRERVPAIRMDGTIMGMAATADGVVAVSTLAKSIRISNIDTGAPIGGPVRLDGVARRMAFSADGHRLASVSPGGAVQVWDRSLAPVGKPIETRAAVYAVTLSGDGERLLTVEREAAREWDVDTGNSIGNSMGGNDSLREAVFTADGRYVVTIETAGRVRMWDASSTEQVAPAHRLTGAVYQEGLDSSGIQLVGLREIGRPLASGAVPVALREDEAPPDELRGVAEALAGRRVATAGFLETLAAEEIADRVGRVRQSRARRTAGANP